MSTGCRNIGNRVAKKFEEYGLLCVLIASLCVNVLQTRRLQMVSRPNPSGPRIGKLVEPLRVTTNNGTHIELLDSKRRIPTVLYYFSPTCGWCERNWANVAILERATRNRYRFIALSSADNVHETATKHDLDFELYGGLKDSLGFAGTPHTIVVSPEGRVIMSWAGAFNDRLRSEVERYFSVVLPGLTEGAELRVP